MVWTIKEQSLCEAIKSGLVSRINKALQNGADVNAKDKERWTLLMYACANEHSKPETLHKLIELLVKKCKADLNEIDKDDKTALDRALGNDKMKSKTKKLLIKSGADISHYNWWSKTVLLRTEQKLNAMQQEMIADMTKDITKLEAQAKKIAKQRMRALRLGQYIHR